MFDNAALLYCVVQAVAMSPDSNTFGKMNAV